MSINHSKQSILIASKASEKGRLHPAWPVEGATTEGSALGTQAPTVDIWMIRDNLKLSYEERIAQHQNTIDFIEELRKSGLKNRAEPSSPSQTFNS